MDGVFMFKWIGRMLILLIIAGAALWFAETLKSNQELKDTVIRLHIIANSDSEEDQAEKLEVRDAVLNYIQEEISKLPSSEEAEAYIRDRLAEIEEVANQILADSGSDHIARVKLGLQEFGKRIYETFSLPSGVYKALQIEIGEAEGKNWWCVVFPGLCMPTSSREFCDVAAAAGFDNDMIHTLNNDGNYKIRFFVLDLWGKVEKFFFKQ